MRKKISLLRHQRAVRTVILTFPFVYLKVKIKKFSWMCWRRRLRANCQWWLIKWRSFLSSLSLSSWNWKEQNFFFVLFIFSLLCTLHVDNSSQAGHGGQRFSFVISCSTWIGCRQAHRVSHCSRSLMWPPARTFLIFMYLMHINSLTVALTPPHHVIGSDFVWLNIWHIFLNFSHLCI